MITPATPASTAGPSTSAAAPSGDSGPPAAKPSYTARLLADRNLRLKKLGEEVAELVLACADQDRARAAEEGADLVYHTLVALRAVGVTLDDVRQVLAARASPTPGR
jgi:phosphoribosyl-ATP pyrophosphohydrolase/phosphoribosyl-AMP cyclohydrolase